MTPEWSERGYWTSGLDPLGLQAFAIELYQKLVPGLTNITVRPRYYSFYTWLCWINAQKDDLRITDATEWRRFIRRSEAIMTLSSLHAELDNGYGMPGVDWARGFSVDDDVVDIRPATDPEYYENEQARYIKAVQGIFGQAYRPVLQTTLGTLAPAEYHEISVPSKGLGDKLAEAFQANVGDAADTFLKCVEAGSVSNNEMMQIGQSFHPLSVPTNSDEWQQLTDIILNGVGGQESEARSRKQSMRLFLEVAKQGHGSPGADGFRWTTYSGYCAGGEKFLCPPEYSDQMASWQAYQSSDLFQLAIGSLFQLCIDLIPHEGIEEKSMIEKMSQDLAREVTSGSETMTWVQFKESKSLVENASMLDNDGSEASLALKIHTAVGSNKKLDAFSGAVAGIRMIAILEKRFNDSDWPASKVYRELISARRSLRDVVSFLELHASMPVQEVLFSLIREFVIKGHLTEAYRKLIGQNNFTFLFQIENGRLTQPAPEIVLNFTTPRLNTSINFLTDLQFIDDNGITPIGASILEGPP
jgi:hypothetical protein